MNKRLLKMVCACVMLITVLASSASAYPKKSKLSSRYECVHTSGQRGMGFRIFNDNTYRLDTDSQDGDYRYNRDAGRVNFKNRGLNEYYLKLSRRDGGGWRYRLREKSNDSLWGSCSQTDA